MLNLLNTLSPPKANLFREILENDAGASLLSPGKLCGPTKATPNDSPAKFSWLVKPAKRTANGESSSKKITKL